MAEKIIAFKYLKKKQPNTTKQKGIGQVLNLIQFPKEAEKKQGVML